MNNCNTEDAKFLAEVKEALKYYGNKWSTNSENNTVEND
jgi:hypothetical protein